MSMNCFPFHLHLRNHNKFFLSWQVNRFTFNTIFASSGRSINPPFWIAEGLDISWNLFKITGPLERVHLFLVALSKPQMVLNGSIEREVSGSCVSLPEPVRCQHHRNL